MLQISNAPKPAPRLSGSLKVNNQSDTSVQPGQPAQLSFSFTDDSGQTVSQFEQDHGKFMHSIVVSKDLSRFAHLHPNLGQDGTFRLDINAPTQDPDNQDASRAVQQGGPYLVFSEVHPSNGETQRVSFGLQADGTASQQTLNPDLIGSGQVQRYFIGDGTVAGEGAPYRVTLDVDDLRSMNMVDFKFHLEAKDANNEYQPVSDATEWLGMKGHAIVVGADGQQPQDRFFNHLHMAHHEHVASKEEGGDHSQEAGPDFPFMLHGQMPADGKYKIWGQFKRGEQVLTFPFAFELTPESGRS
jgi:hypothetical protein